MTLNLYTYVHNNPLRYIDPTGHDVLEVFLYDKTGYHRYKNDLKYYTNNFYDLIGYYGMGGKEILTLIYSQRPEEIAEAIGSLSISFIPIGGQVSKVAKVGKWVDETGEVTDALRKGLGKANFTPQKLQHEWKHAKDFGITGNWNKKNGELYIAAIEKHIKGATNVYISKYRGQDIFVHYNEKSRIGTYTDMDGNYVGGWKLSDEQIKFHQENGKKIY